MTKISEFIQKINQSNKKALSIFLTAGFPSKENFVDIALSIVENGADMLEIGIPFSDPLADGPTIQFSSQMSLKNGVSLKDVFNYCEKIKSKTEKPLILMGYANPILKFGIKNFCNNALHSGVSGLIVPDVPLEEYESFYDNEFKNFEKILLTTPTSSDKRIQEIDQKSEGFVYCVSVTGTTGTRNNFDENVITNLKRTYSLVSKNKMLIGFGISKPDDIKKFSPYCDGVIVGSAVIKKLRETEDIKEVVNFVKSLHDAC
ncbi:tryptophan synthase subunit alpha [Melioribacteraceae bacterium 4301-Me]|uniref:tryptophan synthase subunit alpha n=1 Tax=Pyranulibacter aquaticus TaxID=3163344 RepID=UPI003596BBA2